MLCVDGRPPRQHSQTAKEEIAAVRELILRIERLKLEGLYNSAPSGPREIE